MSAPRNTRPLSTHRAFPAMVGLWFAALLGLGSFVVPPSSYEGLVQASGIASLIPAAAPPLGFTARLAISGAAALAGLLVGLFVASRIRRTRALAWQKAEAPAAEKPASEESGRESVWLDTDSYRDAEPAYDGEEEFEDAEEEGDADDELDRILGSRAGARVFLSDEPEDEPQATPAPTPVSELLDAEEFETDSDDDLDRFAADRLVAGLPVVGREELDGDPLEDWSDEAAEAVTVQAERDATDAAADAARAQEALVSDAEDPVAEAVVAPVWSGFDSGDKDEDDTSDFDAQFLVRSQEPVAHHAPEPDPVPAGRPEPSGPLAQMSLGDLVSRLDAALASSRLAARPVAAAHEQAPTDPEIADEADEQDDPVIAFLRREVDREKGFDHAALPSRGANDDPQASLRSALERLDQVSRKP